MRNHALPIAFAVAAGLWASSPNADELYRFLQLTCSQRLHYFSARVIPIYNPTPFGPYKDEGGRASAASRSALEHENQIYDEISLTRKPQQCRLPGLPEVQGRHGGEMATNIDVVGHYKYVFDEKTSRDLVNIHTVSVVVNGRDLALLDLDGDSRPSSNIASVEVEEDGVRLILIVCRVQGDDMQEVPGDDDALGCTSTKLNAERPPGLR